MKLKISVMAALVVATLLTTFNVRNAMAGDNWNYDWAFTPPECYLAGSALATNQGSESHSYSFSYCFNGL